MECIVAIQAEQPYGLTLSPEKGLFEVGSLLNETATEERWRALLERHGAQALGIRDVPTEPYRCEINGIEWVLERMTARTYQLPEAVYHRILALEAAGVRFAYWLWGEEQFPKPIFAPQTVQPAEQQRDPVVIGVIPTGANRGVWVLCGIWLH